MDSIFEYETIKELVANPPSLDPRPNFFNLRALLTHFARALKHIPCPQSTVNGWSRAVMSKEMYALIDATPFTPGKKLTTNVPDFPRKFEQMEPPSSPTRMKKPSTSHGNLTVNKITTKLASTSTDQYMTHLTPLSETHLR
jgi:hypothetical protein